MKKPQKSVQKLIKQENEKEFSGPNQPSGYLLSENIAWLKEQFGESNDFVLREFKIGSRFAALCFFDGLVNKRLLNVDVLAPLQEAQGEVTNQQIADKLLAVGELKKSTYLNEAAKGLEDGDSVLMIDGDAQFFIIGAKGWSMRSIGQATNEATLRGPQEAFNENIINNVSMVRRRLHTEKLKIQIRTVGTMTKTKVAVMYLEGVANEKIIQEVQRRLDAIKEVDSILDGGCIEQYIEDSTYSPFPQMQITQKPDRVSANLLEGRIALVVDGSPEVLIAPALLVQFLQTAEDYYSRIWAGTFARWIRYIGILVAVLFPALYIAITSYHQEMLTTAMAISIAAAREDKPFPAFLEALIMEVALELLREASIRLPRAISNTLGIVGALVIGQAAVEAQIIAPQVVVVVALTAIGTFTVPSFEFSYPIRLIRFPLMILAAIAGLYGVMVGALFLLIHLVNLKSLGCSYLEPLAPFKFKGLKDVLIRAPRWQMMTKPQFSQAREDAPHNFWQRSFLKVKGNGYE